MKQITLNTANAREAFKFFLLREIKRHQSDIDQIKMDLENLNDVKLVTDDFATWIEIKRKKEE